MALGSAAVVLAALSWSLAGKDGTPVGATSARGGERLERSAPLVIDGESGTVYANLRIRNPFGPCVRVNRSNDITIVGSRIGPCGGEAIAANGVDGLEVLSNTIEHVGTGVRATNGTRTRVIGNRFVDPGTEAVRFTGLEGPGNQIVANEIVGELGDEDTRNLVDVFESRGTEESPLLVVRNRVRGGGSSRTGGGIVVGGGGGAWQLIGWNVLVNPGQIGIGVVSGTDIRVHANHVFQRPQPWSNAGITVWNQHDAPCDSIEVTDNVVDWTKANGSRSPWWDGGNCGRVHVEGNRFDAVMDERIFDHY